MKFLIYLIALVVVLVISYFVKKNRSGKWTELSARRGWQWIGDAKPRIDERLASGPFGTGSNKDDEYVMHGIFDGLDVLSGIYSYQTGFGRSRTTYSLRYVATMGPQTPTLQLIKGGWWVNRKKATITFPDPEFNKRWNITGDEGFVRAVITPQVAGFLMGLDKNCGFLLENGLLTAWIRGGTGKVDEDGLNWACRQLTSFINVIPENVKAAFPQGFPRPDGSGPAPLPGTPAPAVAAAPNTPSLGAGGRHDGVSGADAPPRR